MKKNTQNIILTVLLCVFCLCVLAACSSGKEDYFTYSVDNLNLVGKLVHWMHGWIGNYGWTVVVFTVFLKLIMTPLDLWQRTSGKKSAAKMQRMQPLMEEIDRRYGDNQQKANEEKQKLYKKYGYSTLTMCLPMILSMVIFFVMFAGLRDYSTYSSITNFQNLSGTYFDNYYTAVKNYDGDDGEMYTYLSNELKTQLGDELYEQANNSENFLRDHYEQANVSAYIVSIDHFQTQFGFAACEQFRNSALDKVSEYYKNNHESWLWIQNVWQPDTWASIMPGYTDRTNGFSGSVDMSEFGVDNGQSHYDMIREAVLKTGARGDNGGWNGLMILPIMSVGLSFLSIFLSQLMEKKSKKDDNQTQATTQQAASNKFMMILMPLMMAFFGFMYTGAFAIYMVVNYAMSIISTVALQRPVEKMVEKSLAKMDEADKNGRASYMR